jgi:hypothetical protein
VITNLISELFLVPINWVKQRSLCEDCAAHQKEWTLQQQGEINPNVGGWRFFQYKKLIW